MRVTRDDRDRRQQLQEMTVQEMTGTGDNRYKR